MFEDLHGRRIGYLRLSLTKACAMRCMYCRPKMLGQPQGEPMLMPAEIEALARHLVRHHGLRKIRLTGGDPTSRSDLLEVITRLRSIDGLNELVMTTHGLTLARDAAAMAAAGLDRLNVSLDTLDPARFARLTGVDALEQVLRGIDRALAAGLSPLKLNSVVVKGHNEDDLLSLVAFAAGKGVEIRFIELMPMGPLAGVWAERYVPEAEMRRHLAGSVSGWQELPMGAESARRYRVALADGRQTTIGFITPMSCNFCASCNRIRIAADGTLYPCLMDKPAGTLLPALRPRFDPDELDRRIADGLSAKAPEHPHDGFVVMTHIGG